MKVISLRGNNHIYSCNSYLVLGSWNTLQDMNTLVDVGNDPSIIEVIGKIFGDHPTFGPMIKNIASKALTSKVSVPASRA